MYIPVYSLDLLDVAIVGDSQFRLLERLGTIECRRRKGALGISEVGRSSSNTNT
jgi:hypothetical protein